MSTVNCQCAQDSSVEEDIVYDVTRENGKFVALVQLTVLAGTEQTEFKGSRVWPVVISRRFLRSEHSRFAKNKI